jgi:hypothetical protein
MFHTESDALFEDKLRRFFLEMVAVKAPKDRNEGDAGAFVFHILECTDSFRLLAEMREKPGQFSDAEVKQALKDLLYHDLPHLIAAARLYDYVPDILGKKKGTQGDSSSRG